MWQMRLGFGSKLFITGKQGHQVWMVVLIGNQIGCPIPRKFLESLVKVWPLAHLFSSRRHSLA
jgi:hypothetical protein